MVGGRSQEAGDAGFTLVEVVVALGLAVAIFTATGVALGQLALAVRYARQNQQAIDLAARALEELRSLNYGATAMAAGDLADPDIAGGATGPTFDPDGAGPAPPEPVVVAPGGAVAPHLEDVTVNGTRYTVGRYITDPGDPAGQYRRAVVRVRWTRAGATHERRLATFITLTRRGLPLPNFGLAAPITATVNAGATLVLPATVTNRGARDSWEVRATATGRAWTFAWYRDVDENGTWDPTRDAPPLPDGDADGRPETPILEPDRSVRLFAVFDVPADEPAGTVDAVLTAQSVAQPTAPSATATLRHTVHVVTQACSGCTYRTYYLHNAATGGDTPAQPDMPVDEVAPTQPALPNFDTDHDAAPGRTVRRGGSVSSDDTALVARWRYQAPARLRLAGTALVELFVANATTSTVPLTLTVSLEVQRTGSTYDPAGSTTVTIPAATGFRSVEVHVPVDVDVGRNRRVGVLVTVPAGSEDDAWLAYDTAPHPATIDLPVATGS